MRERLHLYSQILQLNTETMLAFKYAPDGLIRALQMFTVVALVAGLGLWLGIPVRLQRPVLYEELASAQQVIDNVAGSVEPFLTQNIPFLDSPERLARLIGDGAEAASETVNELLATAETETELLSPPLGPRFSRVIRLFGEWISVPFDILARWLPLALVAMLVAKLLGGRATLSQHVTAVLLSAAPLVLLLPSHIPYLGSIMPITFAYGIAAFGNILALVGLAWAALILLKGMVLAHELSWSRAAVALFLSWLAFYVLLPLAGILIAGYVLPL
ncbi:MAG: YIP1 family protein [Candidatus Promineifilaceae bacterium]